MVMLRLPFLAFLLFASVARSQQQEPSRVPVLLELFTSEGCSSCPPADRLLAELDRTQPVAQADLIVLSEHVDYWNRLGWQDPYSSAQFSARQTAYAGRLHDDVYTPQLVVDGSAIAVASDSQAVLKAVRHAAEKPKLSLAMSQVKRDGKQVRAQIQWPESKVKSGVLVVAIASNRAESHVLRGENSGETLVHVAVVRVLQSVGKVNLAAAGSKEIVLSIPSDDSQPLRLVAFLADKSGSILGAAEQKL